MMFKGRFSKNLELEIQDSEDDFYKQHLYLQAASTLIFIKYHSVPVIHSIS